MKAIVVAVYTVEAVDGSALAASIHQDYGEAHVKAYLSSKLPAGSPFAVKHVTVERAS